jgi:hypothetical protein
MKAAAAADAGALGAAAAAMLAHPTHEGLTLRALRSMTATQLGHGAAEAAVAAAAAVCALQRLPDSMDVALTACMLISAICLRTKNGAPAAAGAPPLGVVPALTEALRRHTVAPPEQEVTQEALCALGFVLAFTPALYAETVACGAVEAALGALCVSAREGDDAQSARGPALALLCTLVTADGGARQRALACGALRLCGALCDARGLLSPPLQRLSRRVADALQNDVDAQGGGATDTSRCTCDQ